MNKDLEEREAYDEAKYKLMKNKLIIGIGCKKMSGKDTFATFLAKELRIKYKAQVVLNSFARCLKIEVAFACGETLDTIENNKEIFRPILQWWGTEFRRKYGRDDNYWVNEVRNFISEEKSDIIILTDVRFPNETQFVKSYPCNCLIKIERIEELKGQQSMLNLLADCHASELALEDYTEWDQVIDNDGTLEELEEKAKKLAEVLSYRFLNIK